MVTPTFSTSRHCIKRHLRVSARASNSETEFRNSVIEFQYRFRNSELVNSVIFWALKLTTFGQKLGDFNIFQKYIFFKLFSFQILLLEDLNLALKWKKWHHNISQIHACHEFCKNLAIFATFGPNSQFRNQFRNWKWIPVLIPIP